MIIRHELPKELLEYALTAPEGPQQWLISRLAKAGFDQVDKEGVCHGFSVIVALFIITGNVEYLLRLIQLIHSIPLDQLNLFIQNSYEANKETKENRPFYEKKQESFAADPNDVLAFFNEIELAHHLWLYPQLIDEKTKPAAFEVTKKLPLILPKKLPEGAEEVFRYSGAYDANTLKSALKMIQDTLVKQPASEIPVSFMLESGNHAITIAYIPTLDRWVFSDINNKHPIQFHHDINQVAKNIISAFSNSKQAVFTWYGFSKSSEAPQIRTRLEVLLMDKKLEIKDTEQAQAESWKKIHEITKEKASPTYYDSYGASLLFCAAQEGNYLLVAALLANNADPNASLHDSHLTPLHIAAQYGQSKIVELLLQAGAVQRPATKLENYPIFSAIIRNDVTSIKLMYENVSEIIKKCAIVTEIPTELKENSYFILVKNGQKPCLYYVSKINQDSKDLKPERVCEADPSETEDSIRSELLKKMIFRPNKLGETPLHHAASLGYSESVAYLLSIDADLGTLSKTGKEPGQTPLHLAVKNARPLHLTQKPELKVMAEIPTQLDKHGFYLVHHDKQWELWQEKDNKLIAIPIQNVLGLQQILAQTDLTTLTSTIEQDILYCISLYRDQLYSKMEGGYYQTIKQLITPRTVNKKDTSGATALQYAVEKGDVLAARILIDQKADIEVVDEDKQTLLHIAAGEGHVEMTKYLLSLGMNPLIKDDDDQTVLQCAINNNKSQVVDLLLHDSDVDLEELYGVDENTNETILQVVAKKNHFDTLKILLMKLVHNFDGQTIKEVFELNDNVLLKKAAKAGRADILQILFDYGIDPTYATLRTTVKENHTDAALLLLDKKIDISPKNLLSLFHIAVANGNVNLAQAILHKNIKILNLDRGQSMFLAIKQGGLAMVEFLLTKIKPNKFAHKKSYLEEAIALRNPKAVRALINAGAKYSEEYDDPLYYATVINDVGTVSFLLDLKLNPNNKNNPVAEIPLFEAIRGEKFEIAKRLLLAGSDLKEINEETLTPLNYAKEINVIEIVKLINIQEILDEVKLQSIEHSELNTYRALQLQKLFKKMEAVDIESVDELDNSCRAFRNFCYLANEILYICEEREHKDDSNLSVLRQFIIGHFTQDMLDYAVICKDLIKMIAVIKSQPTSFDVEDDVTVVSVINSGKSSLFSTQNSKLILKLELAIQRAGLTGEYKEFSTQNERTYPWNTVR